MILNSPSWTAPTIHEPIDWVRPTRQPSLLMEVDCCAVTGGHTYFAPEATGAVWDGELLMVRFREVGLHSGAITAVSIVGEGAADAIDHPDNTAICTLSSQALVSDEAVYRADDDGIADSTLVLPLAADLTITGRSAASRPAVYRSFSTTIRDLTTGATTYLTGPATPHPITAAAA